MSKDEGVQQLSDGRWIVAIWSERHAEYQAPMTLAGRKASGGHTAVARTVDGLWIRNCYVYRRRSDALRRARTMDNR